MTDERIWKIKVNNGGQIFFYTGKILQEQQDLNGFLLIQDNKEGPICLNKMHVISMQVVRGSF